MTLPRIPRRVIDLRLALGCTALLAVVWLALAAPAVRADAIEAGAAREQSADPRTITFVVRVRAAAGLKSATLAYKVLNPDGDIGGSQAGTFTPGTETDVTYTLNTNASERYIPVGSRFTYRWQLTDQTGTVIETPEHSFVFLDGRYQWQSRTDGPVTAYWYGDNAQNATAALAAAREALDRIGKLLETTVPYGIRIVVYRSEAEGQLAQRPRGRVFDALVITGGQRVAPDVVTIFSADVEVSRHEVAHIVTHAAGDGPFTSLPAWLDEGTAVYAQSAPGGNYRSAIDFAVRTNRTLSLRAMQAATNQPNEVNLFYGQSWSTVDFLVSTYGQPKLAELYRVHFKGARIDDALKQVYGVDQDGLYNLWRESKGLPKVAVTAVPSGAGQTAPQTTLPPLAMPGAGEAATPQGAGAGAAAEPASDGGSATAGIIVALGTLLVAGLLGGEAFVLLRGRRGGS
ncbi:MAG: hypothetical protein EXR65_05050 [Dehalococcoidia bacterium]|nr:hypothetical protein [Dehalococcoidia bacterium]